MSFAAPSGTEMLRILGMGTIFVVALVEVSNTTCVCKRLTPRMRGEPRARRAAKREAHFLSMARHDALPQLIAHGDDEHGPFILESEAEGISLASLVARGPLPSAVIMAIAQSAYAAMAEIHEQPQEFALGDLSPEDLFIGHRRGAIGFVDFGQSSWRGRPAEPEERGTLPYAPPEVTRGDALWTQASDVYALAALMVFAAIGEVPCRTEGAARIAEIADQGLDLDLVAGCRLARRAKKSLAAALAFDPHHRTTTAADVLCDLV